MGLGDLVQKAFYLGVGLAAYAGEQAGGKLGELQQQAQKIADEMVQRGEMTTEEARRFMDDIVRRAQEQAGAPTTAEKPTGEPRRIEILDDDEVSSSESPKEVEDMRQTVRDLQEELRRLKKE
ncbi:MAG: hypothetical protein HC925_09795 [Coleofasciculaceae cyanobacterium SM2_3_26]|nr:hypothetical protein [Coleofasciculaceae cyanobacterium SM2_3_26]